jgi:hypothetical protein
VPAKGESFKGHVFSTFWICVSIGISIKAAWQPELGWGCVLLFVITIGGESSKYFCNRIIFISRHVSRRNKTLAWLWYCACIASSVLLMQSLMQRITAEQVAAVEGQASQAASAVADQTRVEGDIAAIDRELEAARTAIVPGIRSAAELRLLLDHATTTARRVELKDERDKAEGNDRMTAKIARLVAKRTPLANLVAKSTPERSETFGERSSFGIVRNIRERSARLNDLALASAILIEICIMGGFWADGLHNRGQAAPEPILTPTQPPNAGRTMQAETFEAYLFKEWRTKRDRDGWLRGTQQGWARAARLSSATVHAQLNALVAAGKVEKQILRKETWVRFIKQAGLSIVRP